MLPDVIIPDINETPKLGKSFLFDFEKNELAIKDGKFVKITGIDVIKQWINFTLRVEKYKYLIYQEHGVEIDSILENNLPYKLRIIELERTIKEALEVHEYIRSLSNFNFERVDSKLKIDFRVNLIDGTSFGGGTVV